MDIRLKGKPGWVKIWLVTAIPGVLYYFVRSFLLENYDFSNGEIIYVTYGFLTMAIFLMLYGFKKDKKKED